MKRSQLKNSFLLLLTAAIWGSAFVAQSVGMDYVKPFTFNGIRSAIGALFLIPCIFFFQNRTNSSEVSPADQLNQSAKTLASSPIARKTLFFGGLCCGIVLAAASSLQQIGISYTSVGKAGFLTAIYIVLVPILSLFLKKRCSNIYAKMSRKTLPCAGLCKPTASTALLIRLRRWGTSCRSWCVKIIWQSLILRRRKNCRPCSRSCLLLCAR